MNRTLCYKKVTNDGIDELDFLWNTLTEIKTNRPPGYYRAGGDDVMRPDLISYKIYGSVSYWWAILVQNGIGDAFFEITPGLLLEVPNMLDVYDFYRSKKVRI